MKIRADKLIQHIHLIQDLLQSHLSQHSTVQQVIRQLDQVVQTLEAKQLRLHFVSQNLSAQHNLAERAKHLIQKDENLAAAYDIHYYDLQDLADIALIRDCDVLCLVLDNEQHLSNVKLNCFKANITIPQQFLLTTDAAAVSQHLAQFSEAQNIEVVTLPLETSSTCEKKARSHRRQDNSLIKNLQALVRRRPEDLLAERLVIKISSYLSQLEHLINQEIEDLSQQLANAQSSQISSGSPEAIKRQFDQTLRQIQDEAKQQFGQVKADLEQSRAEILDEFNRNSLVYQIQQLVIHLQPQIIRRSNAKYIQLCSRTAPTGTDVNVDLVQLCYSFLSQWNATQWRKIYIPDSPHSLGGFLQTVYHRLQQVPCITVHPWQTSSDVDAIALRQCFKHPVASAVCESYYKETSIMNYIIRQMRNQWMSIMFLLTFITMIGLTDNKGELIENIFSQFTSLRDSPILLTASLAVPFCGIFAWLFSNFDQDSNQKLQEEANKLKKNLCGYYQAFAKYASDLLLKDFMKQLEAEQMRLQKKLDLIQIELEQTLQELEQQNQAVARSQQSLVHQQQALSQVIDAIRKLQSL